MRLVLCACAAGLSWVAPVSAQVPNAAAQEQPATPTDAPQEQRANARNEAKDVPAAVVIEVSG